MSTELAGKIAFVSGASRGIGAATARILSERGAKVLIHGRSNSTALSALAAKLDTSAVYFDVSDRDAVHRELGRLVDELRPPDIVALAAGVVEPVPVSDLRKETHSREFEVNLWGTIHCCQALAPAMKAHGRGSIVTVSSIRGIKDLSSARGSVYSASKAAVISFSASLAKELSPAVRVNCVAPGFTATEMSASWNETVWTQASSNLLGRVAKPHEIAEAIAFLASDRASFITGEVLTVDGGYGGAGK